ncbi:hypothetical protein Srufu_070580 [Streptomyces libani subsp. rufus]|nr:hypothetical protein Srufu_070580 [Streptomyces libani subsp. rufus]
MRQHTALVIGGGIGGLTAALALDRRGWSVTVLERAAALEPVGAGIGLAPNAQRALDTLGAGDGLRALAPAQTAAELRLPGGRRLARLDQAAAVRRYGGPVVVAHRAEVVALLAGRLPQGTVRTVRCPPTSARAAARPSRTPSCSPTWPHPRPTSPPRSPRTPGSGCRAPWTWSAGPGGSAVLTTWRSRPARALRAALMAVPARLAPDLALRAMDGIADWRPPTGTYASGTRGTTSAAQPKEHE